jgi:hypothetical protein
MIKPYMFVLPHGLLNMYDDCNQISYGFYAIICSLSYEFSKALVMPLWLSNGQICFARHFWQVLGTTAGKNELA